MPINQVILTITNGQLCGERHVFIERQPCLIGRAPDCDIQLSGDISFANISRHHCMLDIDPPAVRVRDLGSRNGTFLNGERIGDDGPYLENEDRIARLNDPGGADHLGRRRPRSQARSRLPLMTNSGKITEIHGK